MRVKGFFGRDRADQEAFAPTVDIPRSNTQAAVEYVEALGGVGGGGTDAPVDAQYLVSSLNTTLTNERVVGNGTGITWDFTGTGSAVANLDFLGLEDLTDPNADRVLFWDDSEGAFKWLTMTGGLGIVGANLSISDTDLAGIRDTTFAAGDIVISDGAALTNLIPGAVGMYLRSDGPGNPLIWANISGGGDVTANSVWGTDNLLIRADGTGKGVQASGISIDDTNNVTGVTSITVGNAGLIVGASTPFSDAAGTLTLQNVDALDATTEATIEAAIDTLANLTSIQGVAFTLGAYAPTILNTANELAFKQAVNLEIGVDVQAYDADLATWAGLTPSANAQSLVTAVDYAAMRALLDLEAGTDFLSPAAIAAAYQPLDADLTAWAGVNPSSYSTTAQIAAAYQPLDADLTTIAGLSSADSNFIVGSATGWVVESGATVRTSLGLGTMATETATDYLTTAAAAAGYQPLDADLTTWAGVTSSANGRSLVSAADYAAMRALLDLEVGTDFLSPAAIAAAYQPLDGDLTNIAALATTAAGRSALTIADPNADRVVAWDDTAGTMSAIALADITTEAAPATGDFVLIYGAEGDLRKVDWSSLPGGSGSANAALSNLAAVAINTTLVSDTDNTDDIGTSLIFWRTGYFKTSIELGATDTTLTRASAGQLAVEGVNVLMNGGALGTPSSGTLTNCTGLPLSGVTDSTSEALGVGTLEVGHASDTTLSRSAAGILAVEGVVIKNTGRETIWIPASAMYARTTNGAASGTAEAATNRNMFKTLDFDTATQEFAQFEIHLPKSWNLGTVTFQPVWSHAATTVNFGVVWQLAGIARSDDDAGDVAFGTAQTSTDTGGTTNDIYIGPESAAITIGGTPASGDTVLFQVARAPANGSDTMAIDARLHGLRLFFTTNAATDA